MILAEPLGDSPNLAYNLASFYSNLSSQIFLRYVSILIYRDGYAICSNGMKLEYFVLRSCTDDLVPYSNLKDPGV